MTSTPKQRIEALTSQLSAPPSNPNTSSDLPTIRQVAPPSTEPRVKDKIIIITGCSSPIGIGLATAHQFAANGATALYLCDFTPTHLSTHAQHLTTLYPSCSTHYRIFDAADESAVKGVIDEAIKTYGRLDIFFANAGIRGTHKHFKDIQPEELMNTLRTNVLSVFLALKYASAAMLLTSSSKPSPGGSIIATASVAALRSNAGSSDYSASKASVLNLVQTFAYQLTGTGVRVNALLPGLIETDMTKEMYDQAKRKGREGRVGKLNPMQRGGQADEVARVALFLGSEEGSYVNGQGWAVDGGLSAGLPFVGGRMA